MTDLIQVLDELGLQIATAGDREISLHCPFHADRHPSFYMNANTGLFLCFSCGRRGTIELLAQELKGQTVTPLLREAKYHQAIQRETEKVAPPEPDPHDSEWAQLRLYAQYERFRPVPKWALESRDIDRPTADRYGIKWDKGWVLPLWAPTVSGDVRDLWGWQFKQLKFVSNHPTSIRKSKTLFGLNCAQDNYVVLVESPLDAARLGTYGICSVASCGAFVSKAQISILIERFDRVFLALDRDVEGISQTNRLYPVFARMLPTVKIRYPKSVKDAGELEPSAVQEVFSECLLAS